MPKKKPRKVDEDPEQEPEVEHMHPYIPSDTKELFGYEILWLSSMESIDYSTTPDEDDPTNNRYNKKYHGKIVVAEAISYDKDCYVNDPLIFDENGFSYYNVPRVAVIGFLEEVNQYNHVVKKLADADEEIDDLQAQIKEKDELLTECKDLAEALQADLEHWKAEAAKIANVDGNVNSLRGTIGGDPKEVVIKW